MAAQTLTAASNFDGPSLMLGLNNGEAITVNGGALTIDSDVRWGQNGAVHGSITVSATLGGSVLFEGRNVWELPFTAATGNVPALAPLGSNGVTGGTSAATGELLRVWATSSITPATAGGAMPATGWVKLRSKSGAFVGGEVVTLPGGATITISGPGKRSWLHIVGAENGTITIPRLADVKWRGEWYELGTTNGADDQTFQFPVADACPAMWVEKYPGSYNLLGEFGLEPWLAAGDRWGTATAFVAQDVRGKYFGQNLTTGAITIAQRASNACGYKPDAGLKVFVPNLVLSSSTAANWASNTLNSSVAGRYKTATDLSGSLDVAGVSANWYFLLTTPAQCAIVRSGVLDQVLLSGVSNTTLLEDFAVGLRSAITNYTALSMLTCYGGAVLRRNRLGRSVQGEALILTDCSSVRGFDVQIETFGAAGSTTRSASSITVAALTRCADVEIDGFAALGARVRGISCARTTFRPFVYADNLIGTGAVDQLAALECGQYMSHVTIDGLDFFGGLPNMQPTGAALVFAQQSCSDIVIQNIGSPGSPLDGGSINQLNRIADLSATDGVVIRRVYLQNIASPFGAVALRSSVRNVELTNVWIDGNDIAPLGGVNVLAKGCRWTDSTSAQTSAYGTHWQDAFQTTTAGRIVASCNEPSPESSAQCTFSFSGKSGFTGAGRLAMTSLGDWAEWTMPHFALGHARLANTAPTINGDGVGNHLFEFQADTGTGFGGWQTLSAANLDAVGAINPAVGVKLKLRATVTGSSATNLLTSIRIDTVTDATSQQIQYPLPLLAELTLTGLQPGSDVVILAAGTETELANVDAHGATTYAYGYDTPSAVDIGVFKVGFVPLYIRNFPLPSSNAVLPISQVADRNYINP